jgi:hypothetical protein
MKTKLLLTTLASLIVASTAQAQLGLTTEQCKQLFGQPSSEDNGGLTFERNNEKINAIVSLENGKVDGVTYAI